MEQPKKECRFPKFQERLRELQGEMSNTEFADFLGITRQTIGFYLNGHRIPDILCLAQISRRCNVSADWLIGTSDVKSTNADTKATSKYIGLSEESISFLSKVFREFGGANSPTEVLNDLLNDAGFQELLVVMARYKAEISIEKERTKDIIERIQNLRDEHARKAFVEEAVNLLPNCTVTIDMTDMKPSGKYLRFLIIDNFTKSLDAIYGSESCSIPYDLAKERDSLVCEIDAKVGQHLRIANAILPPPDIEDRGILPLEDKRRLEKCRE